MCYESLFAFLHSTAMRPSLQMQKSVDKQIEHEFAFALAVHGSLPDRFVEADKYLTMLVTKRVGEHVWRV